MTNAEARFNNSLFPRKPEGSLGRTAQDGHLDSHTAPELCLSFTCLFSPIPFIVHWTETCPFMDKAHWSSARARPQYKIENSNQKQPRVKVTVCVCACVRARARVCVCVCFLFIRGFCSESHSSLTLSVCHRQTSSHTPSIAFRHPPPNSARFSYATKGALFISAQLSSNAVSALRKHALT